MSFLLPFHRFFEIILNKNILSFDSNLDQINQINNLHDKYQFIIQHLNPDVRKRFIRFSQIYKNKIEEHEHITNIDCRDNRIQNEDLKLIQTILLQYYICP